MDLILKRACCGMSWGSGKVLRLIAMVYDSMFTLRETYRVCGDEIQELMVTGKSTCALLWQLSRRSQGYLPELLRFAVLHVGVWALNFDIVWFVPW